MEGCVGLHQETEEGGLWFPCSAWKQKRWGRPERRLPQPRDADRWEQIPDESKSINSITGSFHFVDSMREARRLQQH